MQNINYIQKAISSAGGQGALALALGVSRQVVWNWLHRDKLVPAQHCLAVEKISGISRKLLRPNDWQKFWPELKSKQSK